MKNEIDNIKTAAAAEQFTRERNYWLNRFADEFEKTYFPYDFLHTGVHGVYPNERKMESVKFSFPGDLSSRLIKLSNRFDPRLHVILVTGLILILHKYTGNGDIIVGAPIYIQDKEGELINTVLALRNRLENEMTFKQLLLQVNETIVEAVDHQNYPVERLVQKLNFPGKSSGFPLFDAAILLGNCHNEKYLDHINHNMTFSLLRIAEEIEGKLKYNSLLYSKATSQRIIKHLIHLLEQAVFRVDTPIADIDVLPADEKHKLLVEFNNNTQVEYPRQKTIQQLFEEQVERTPDHTAVFGQTVQSVSLTYRKLNEQSNQLARMLIKKGVRQESVVGIMIDPSLEMVIGLIAILKAGGAYLPIDPGLPPNRVLFMLNNSGALVVLTDSHSMKDISFTQFQRFEENKDIPIHMTAPRPPIAEFGILPAPDRSHINLLNYKNKIGMASVTNCISIQTTRGCPYECLYCHKIWSKKHVHRDAESIYGEINYFYKNGVTNFAIIDDCFNLNTRESSKLFELLIKNKLKIQLFFPNGLRGDIMTPGYIDLMVEAGTRGINLSLETASPRLQKLLKKNLNLDKFKEVVNYIAAAHSNIILEMATMHGFPSETEEEAMMTLNFIKDIKWLHFPYIHILKIFPNTEMEAFALEQGVSKQDIMQSKNRAFHELPETLPFPKSFTRKYQAGFLNEYFLAKERLKNVLPVQMNILSEAALTQKYNAYLPVEIKSIRDVIEFSGVEGVEIPVDYGREENRLSIFDRFPVNRTLIQGARRILFLDLSQHFSSHQMLYRVVEQPLGAMYLLTYLKQQFGDRIDGRIYKSGNDFDNFEELRKIVHDFQPQLIGIRTLTFFKDFFHETAALIRHWGITCPIITGGPYASSDYDTILKDKNIDLVVLGEGEYTLVELITEMMKNDFKLPPSSVMAGIKGIVYAEKVYAENFSINEIQRQVILMDRYDHILSGQSCQNPESVASGNNLAYVMYTSGTTGMPKGVMVEHQQVNNCIHWMQEKFQLTNKDSIAQRTNLMFDPSVWEIFWPLYVGAKVKLLTRQQGRDAEYLLHLMADDRNVTVLYCPSPLLTAITYLLNQADKKSRLKLTWLIIGAESIRPEVIKDFYSYYEGKIVNTYGPTEGTINNTYYDIHRSDKCSIVPIGKPVANNQIYILSPDMKPQPMMVAGEIHIGGDSVARGYINNREKTDLYFIANPFGEGKLYKTGDIGRWWPDGVIEIMGRVDEQIKIRGYRMEPGEIRSALLGHKAIKDCIITVVDNKESESHNEDFKTCKSCGITTQYPRVTINDDNLCEICKEILKYQSTLQAYFKTLGELEQTIRNLNKTKTGIYDCLLLYSGGRGAANALYKLHDMGFKILTATYDNGYMGKADIANIKMITSKLNVDHVILTHKNTDNILRESLKTAHTVCRGCFLTSSSLAAEYAYKNSINVVVGATLSRGQIIDSKLFMFLQQGITDINEFEATVSRFQQDIPKIEKSYFDLIDIEAVKDGSVHKKVTSLDFYRYCEMTNEEMISYLNERDPYWKTRKSYAVYSTNCPIKQIGDYAHLQERGFHFYGPPTSWEKRLGHLALKNIKEDLECRMTPKGFANFLKRVQYDRTEKENKTDKYLCAYFIPDKPSTEGEYSASELRNYLLQTLPEYMIPHYFVPIEKIPLTTNGKVDRKALPSPKLSRLKLDVTYVAPATQLEKTISETWKELLGVDRVGVQDNFFDLGGNSLNIVMMEHKLKEALNIDIPVVTLFTYPTISSLTKYLEEEKNRETISASPASAGKADRSIVINEGKNMMKRTLEKIEQRK